MNATAAQIRFISKLREDKAYRMNFAPECGAEHAPDPEAYIAAQHAGRAAYEAPLDGITKAEASAIIDALKAW